MSWKLNSKGLWENSGRERGKGNGCCFVFPSSTKREIRHFLVVVAQRRLRNVQESMTHMPKLLFCQSKPIIAFLRFSLPSPSSLLKLPICQKLLAPCKGIQDSWILDSTQTIPDFRDWIPELWIPNLHCKIKWRILMLTHLL